MKEHNREDKEEEEEDKKVLYHSKEELLALVTEKYIPQRTPDEEEMVDPLERVVRYLVPIPKEYYWDVIQSDNDLALIPTHIKVWHKTIAYSTAAGNWTNGRIAQPIASAIGLTGSRFSFVTDHMTKEDMEASQRNVLSRKANDSRELKVTGYHNAKEDVV